MSRYAFIYNPGSRGGRAEQQVSRLKSRIETLENARFIRSEQKGDIAEKVTKILPETDVVVACGGDGTAREVASVLAGTSKIMGIIPMGSGNDLCKTLGIPTDLNRSFEIIVNHAVTAIDTGQCNDFVFLNSLGFGFDGLTNRFAAELLHYPPLFRYAIAALKAVGKQQAFRVSIEQESGLADKKSLLMIALANGKVEGGSFWIAPQADIADGQLEMVTVDPLKRWKIPFLLPFILLKKTAWLPYIRTRKISSLQLKFERTVAIHADGEIIENAGREFQIRVKPADLKVITGPLR